MATTLFTQNTIACIWDFDKTLIPEYMQSPLFRRYGIDEANFWAETNGLIEQYRRRGYHLAGELGYLNHLLTYTKRINGFEHDASAGMGKNDQSISVYCLNDGFACKVGIGTNCAVMLDDDNFSTSVFVGPCVVADGAFTIV